jgi:hypothetical protein
MLPRLSFLIADIRERALPSEAQVLRRGKVRGPLTPPNPRNINTAPPKRVVRSHAGIVQVCAASWKAWHRAGLARPPNEALSGEPLFRLAAAHSGTPAAAILEQLRSAAGVTPRRYCSAERLQPRTRCGGLSA